MTRTSKFAAAVGVSDHAGWAVLVTVARGGTLLDRRRIELLDSGLPAMPHHHPAKGLSLDEAVAVVGLVRESAQRRAHACLNALAGEVPVEIAAMALRICPPLPEAVAERITNYRASNAADWAMYRAALANAAEARGWFVHWYDAKRVIAEAADALPNRNLDDLIRKTGAALGPPWQKDQRMAMAAAIAAQAVKGSARSNVTA